MFGIGNIPDKNNSSDVESHNLRSESSGGGQIRYCAGAMIDEILK
jgi:hypothetical protein